MGNETPDIDQTKKQLFQNAVKGLWLDVIKIYRKEQRIHNTKITRSGGTALHIAVSDGQENVVEELVKTLRENGEIDALKLGDDRGNTPLHTAASLGSARMCSCIADADSSLIGARNNDSETPFFLAALHGHKFAFLCLHSICGTDRGYTYCRRKDGETILHSAISGDYFGN